MVASLRSVQKETNTLLTQEIERQGGSGDVQDDNNEEDDELSVVEDVKCNLADEGGDVKTGRVGVCL